ncbi:MAG: energy transducer TonB [Bacteroidales bacterium]|jgi:protein TonB|nr:energy transducer TonB [Bacteroidales bacterium]
MKPKKSIQANLETKRSLFFQTGLLLALVITFAAFEWRVASQTAEVVWTTTSSPGEEIDMMPVTRTSIPPPPPAPHVADILEIVDNHLPEVGDVFIPVPEVDPVVSCVTFTAVPQIKDEDDDEEVIFFRLEEQPTFDGLIADVGFTKFVGAETEYPQIAITNHITGKIIVGFVIERDGSVSNVKILRGGDPSLEAEAIRVIQKSSNHWTPGKQRGKAVRVKYTFPVHFRLN